MQVFHAIMFCSVLGPAIPSIAPTLPGVFSYISVEKLISFGILKTKSVYAIMPLGKKNKMIKQYKKNEPPKVSQLLLGVLPRLR